MKKKKNKKRKNEEKIINVCRYFSHDHRTENILKILPTTIIERHHQTAIKNDQAWISR